MNETLSLFANDRLSASSEPSKGYRPLADRLRPSSWDAFQGLADLEGELISFLKRGQGLPPSLILWGPPGSGKTTLAKIIGASFACHFVQFSAVLGGVKEVREIVSLAKKNPDPTLLFVDEIHRFNKSQQDAFLPHIENGTIVLIGATTENPSFYLNSALLSRARVIVLPLLSEESLDAIVLSASEELGIHFESDAAGILTSFCGGDARRLLNAIEGIASAVKPEGGRFTIDVVRSFIQDATQVFYDRDGEEHYNMASAFIKSMRGSDPDGALYWGFRMLEGGEDPRFLLRRMMIFASEDIGNADPRALTLAVSTIDAYERLGLPEGRIPIAHCITYLASAPKSNRSYVAMHAAVEAVKENPSVPVPLHLRNAPTKLMKELSYGKDYEYSHNVKEGESKQAYLPDELSGRVFYEPKESGYEKMIIERLKR